MSFDVMASNIFYLQHCMSTGIVYLKIVRLLCVTLYFVEKMYIKSGCIINYHVK